MSDLTFNLTAKDYLKKVKEKQSYWERKQIELLQLKDLETKCTTSWGTEPVQSSGNQDKLGSNITKRIVFEEAVVNKAKEDFFSYRDECIKLLEQVKEIDFLHYIILHQKYIEYKSLKKIAKKESYCYQYIKESHLKALKNVQKILDSSNLPT